MSYRKEYGALLEAIANEADALATRYFRADGLRVERKRDGTAVTQADRAIEKTARAKVAASGLDLTVFGEELGADEAHVGRSSNHARLIIDPIDGTEEFSRGIPTFGTLMGIERGGEIVGRNDQRPSAARSLVCITEEKAPTAMENESRYPLAERWYSPQAVVPAKAKKRKSEYAAWQMRPGTHAPSADSGSRCWWRRARSKRRSIGHRSPGT